MIESPPSPEFEDKVRTALVVPEPDAVFLKQLETRLISDTNRPSAKLSIHGRIIDMFLRPAWKVALGVVLLIAVIILVIGPREVLASVRGWLGYIPGIGFVDTETPVRMILEPVVQERDGVTMTVDQFVVDAQHTIVIYHIDGIQPEMRPDREDAPNCSGSPVIRLPDEQLISFTGGEVEGWPGGYRSNYIFKPIPEEFDQVTWVVPCLENTAPGAAPEDWEIELELMPAPADMQPLPVVELVTHTPEAASSQEAMTPSQPELAATESQANQPQLEQGSVSPYGITFAIESWVELEDAFILQGVLDWRGTDYQYASFYPHQLEVRDADGQQIMVERVETNDPADPYRTRVKTWATQTESKGYSNPVTVNLPSVEVIRSVDFSFELDLGDNPQPGDSWEVDAHFDFDGPIIHFKEAELELRDDGTYWIALTFQTDDPRTNISIWDNDNHSQGVSSEGRPLPDGLYYHAYSFDYLPTGIHHISVDTLMYYLDGPWIANVELPASASTPQPSNQSEVCLDPDLLQQLQNEPASKIPAGLDGKLLVHGPALDGIDFPTLYLIDLDSGDEIMVGSGARGAITPNGEQVAYQFSDGLHLFNISSGENWVPAWGSAEDNSPIWSPDGEWLAFNRSLDGVYITQPDGSGLQEIPNTGSSTSLIGWSQDGGSIVITRAGADGYVLQSIHITSGEVSDLFTIESYHSALGTISPDGARIAYPDKVFGQVADGIYIAYLEGSGKKLIASFGFSGIGISTWSPDGSWLLLRANEYDENGERLTNLLVQPDTCQVIRLEYPESQVDDWVDD